MPNIPLGLPATVPPHGRKPGRLYRDGGIETRHQRPTGTGGGDDPDSAVQVAGGLAHDPREVAFRRHSYHRRPAMSLPAPRRSLYPWRGVGKSYSLVYPNRTVSFIPLIFHINCNWHENCPSFPADAERVLIR